MPKIKKPEQPVEAFWITNISKKIVSLADLGLCIYPQRSVNLLDKKHYSLTKEQLIASATSGSLLAKKTLLSIRKVPPPDQPKFNTILLDENAIFQTRQRSAIKHEKIEHEELKIADEDYAEENSEDAAKEHLGKWNNK